jgi:hypothetical protein
MNVLHCVTGAALAFILLCQSGAMAQDAKAGLTASFSVPEGFVLQHLDATDGLIARPKDWHYASHGDPAGWTWIISAEDSAKGYYETGLRIQMIVGIQKKTGKTQQAFAQSFLEEKHRGGTVLSECQPAEQGQFMRQCLEVLENISMDGTARPFHVSYSAFWGKAMDMVVITTFGTPADRWAEFKTTAGVMNKFVLIGPNFGKDQKPAH